MSQLAEQITYESYNKAKNLIYGHDSSTRDLTLTTELFKRLDINFDRWLRVAVTGSKGKGSTCIFLASILAASGEKVGLITSPSLRKFNERIRINGVSVTDKEIDDAAKEIAPTVKQLTSEIKPPRYIGPGGIILALAAKIFIKHKITALIVESGRGGEYDESSLIKPDLSIITPITLKHAKAIGPTIEDIATTKTYISSEKSIIVSARQNPTVQKAIEKVAKKLSSQIISLDSSEIKILNEKSDINGNSYDLQISNNIYKNISTSLVGSYQIENSAIAIASTLTLKKIGAKCTKDGIYNGVSRAIWYGRCQTLQKNPWIFLDGTINALSAKYLVPIVNNSGSRNLTATIAIHNPNDLEGVCSVLAKKISKLILTEVSKDSLDWDRKKLLNIGSKYFKDIKYIDTAEDAFSYVRTNTKKGDGVLLLGHQSFVGAALEFWNVETSKLW